MYDDSGDCCWPFRKGKKSGRRAFFQESLTNDRRSEGEEEEKKVEKCLGPRVCVLCAPSSPFSLLRSRATAFFFRCPPSPQPPLYELKKEGSLKGRTTATLALYHDIEEEGGEGSFVIYSSLCCLHRSPAEQKESEDIT